MSEFTQDLILHYFMVGTGFTLLLDIIIRIVKASEPYTAVEVATSIVLWPVMVCILIVNFIKGFKNV